jgi:sulfur-carrier protein adenylyltransferase/sulfurtransferase
LGSEATDIRPRAPETFAVHQQVIDWDLAFSPNGLQAGRLGLSRASPRMMRWAMRDWSRLDRLNRWFGTWSNRAQLD